MSLDLWLVVQDDSGETRDVAVRVQPETTVGELAAAFARSSPPADGAPGATSAAGAIPVAKRPVAKIPVAKIPVASTIYCHRRRAWLPEHDLITHAGLQHGDVVAVGRPGTGPVGETATDANAVVSLRISAGPGVGSERQLAAGEYTIGRAEDADIRLDDPFVAPRHARLAVGGDQLLVTELAPGSVVKVDGDVIAGSRALRAGQSISLGESTLEISSHLSAPVGPGATTAEAPFNRPPRVIQAAPGTLHQLPAPPVQPGRARLPIAAALLPLLLGGVMLLFYRSPLTLVFLAMSPLLAIGSYLEGRLGGRGDHRRAVAVWRGQLEELQGRLAAGKESEIVRRREEAPDLRRLAISAHRRESWVWERRPQDDDFLQLRVALTTAPSGQRVEIGRDGDPALQKQAEAVIAPLTSVEDVPLVLPLAERGALGLAGPRQSVLDAARWILVQAAVLHSPRNLAICAAMPREESEEWDWLKWLPHTQESVRPFDGPALCVDNPSCRDLGEKLVALLDSRLADVGPYRGTSTRAPYSYLLLLLHEDVPLARRTVARLLAEGPRVGIVTVWLGSAARDLPNECGAVIEVDAPGKVALTFPSEGEVRGGTGTGDRATAAEARQVALELAPMRDTAAGDSRGELPRQVGLLDLLDLPAEVSARDIGARWSGGAEGLAAPIGVSADGRFALDLRADGPHGLVGGTTGAGKSELLQTLVASLAASHSPARLNFLLVDYKGGSAFKDAALLPHTVGLVTDLDGHLANRALVSLRAELRRRERVLRESSVRDMAELERRGGTDCPASLVIVVDEFATLAKEVPDFVDGVVDLAQRGRSLGLHLVLATQRPAGVINDNIRANTNLRVALRVSDESESNDVIGVPDAARIPRTWPGRGFARTGHQELTEFQSAFAGLIRPSSRASNPVEIVDLPINGPVFSATAGGAESEDDETDLQRLVAAISAAGKGLGGPPARRPWLPELPNLLPAAALVGQVAADTPGVVLGRVDLPGEQRQEAWTWDPKSDGNLLVLGTSGSGKTSLLRTIAHALALKQGPSLLHLYAIDCAGGGLAPVQQLPQCGGFFLADDTERIARLVGHLRAVIDRRRAQAAGISAGQVQDRDPAIVVLLDSYPGFLAAMEKVDLGEHIDALPRLIADGPSVGVRFVVSADRRGAVPSAVSSLVGTRIVLRLSDEDEYRSAGITTDAFSGAHLPPGRGFLGQGQEVQCAVLGDSGEATEQAQVLAETGAAIRKEHGEVEVPGVRLLPSHLDVAQLSAPSAVLRAVIGLADPDSRSAELDLADDGQLIAGPPHSGRSNTLVVAVKSLRQSTPGVRIFLLAPRKSPLLALDGFEETARGIAECEALAGKLEQMVLANSSEPGPVIVVVDDGDELSEGTAAMRLESVVRRGRDLSVRIIAAVETRAAHRAYGGWIPELRKTRQGILLQPDVDIDGDLLGVRLPRRGSRVFPPGRGFLVHRGVAELVQVAVPTTT